MDSLFYCYRCQAAKTAADVRQQVLEETCVYVCRQCGTPEGVWLQRCNDDAPPAR